MAKRNSDTGKTEYIRISATQMAIYIAVFIGGTAFAAALNLGIDTMKVRSLQDKYDDLKTEYDNLKLEYEKQTDQKYWKEYIVHEGDVVIDQRLNCSITIGHIYDSLGEAFIYFSKFGEDGEPEKIEMKKAVPYDLTGKGDFFVVIKEFGDDSFTMIISEK